MNREIKFRVWNGKKMVFGPTDENPNASWVLVLASTLDTTPMQFTGFKDKNDTEIYEGDIVEGKKINKSEVIFYNGKFTTADSNDDAYFVDLCDAGKVEVIGSIYKTPHLLK